MRRTIEGLAWLGAAYLILGAVYVLVDTYRRVP